MDEGGLKDAWMTMYEHPDDDISGRSINTQQRVPWQGLYIGSGKEGGTPLQRIGYEVAQDTHEIVHCIYETCIYHIKHNKLVQMRSF